MLQPLFLLLALLAAATLAYFLWARFTRAEVKLNAADILADGSADTLRKGYHARRTWARFWPWLGLTLIGSLAASLSGWPAFLTSFAAVGVLLAGYFARYFTPWLNVARGLPEFHASSDSASWPDAAAWKHARAASASTQDYADSHMGYLIRGTWLYCRLAAGVLGVAAAALVIHS